MTHDPLCYLYREDGEFNLMADRCVNCKLIAKVRADERERSQDEIYEWRIKASDQYGHGFHEGWKRAIADELTRDSQDMGMTP